MLGEESGSIELAIGTRGAAGVILLNSSNELLIVKPTYRTGWLLPGGMVEHGESPRTAAERELTEELGLTRRVNRLLCVDYQPAGVGSRDNRQYLFFGGVLSAADYGDITLPDTELSECRFAPLLEALTLLTPHSARRLPFAMQALWTGTTVLLENGTPRQ